MMMGAGGGREAGRGEVIILFWDGECTFGWHIPIIWLVWEYPPPPPPGTGLSKFDNHPQGWGNLWDKVPWSEFSQQKIFPWYISGLAVHHSTCCEFPRPNSLILKQSLAFSLPRGKEPTSSPCIARQILLVTPGADPWSEPTRSQQWDNQLIFVHHPTFLTVSLSAPPTRQSS